MRILKKRISHKTVKYFTLALACGMCSAVSLSAAAMQEDIMVEFSPKSTWDVKKQDTPGSSPGQCSIQSEFNNGFIVQFEGTNDWVQTFKLDIRQDAFAVGQKYNVIVSVPGHVVTTLEALATQKSVIALPLKGRKDLYQAMRDQGVVDIEIEGNAFRFALNGIPAAAQSFETCMAGGAIKEASTSDIMPAQDLAVEEGEIEFIEEAKATPPAVVPTKKPDIPDVKDHKDIPGKSNPKGYTEEDAVRALNEHALKALKIRAETRESMQQDIASVESHAGDLSAGEQQNDIPSISVTDSETTVAVASQTASQEISPEEEALMQEVLLPELENAKDATPAQDVGPVKATLPGENRTVGANAKDPLEKSLEKALEKRIKDNRPEREKPEHPLEKPLEEALKKSLGQTQSKIGTPDVTVHKTVEKHAYDFTRGSVNPSDADMVLMARISSLEEQLESVQAENTALNDELETTLREGEQERLSIVSENWDLERATKRFNEAERQMKKLGLQLQKERAQCKMEKQELETMLFDPELTDEAQLAKLSKLEQELAEAKAMINSLQANTGIQ